MKKVNRVDEIISTIRGHRDRFRDDTDVIRDLSTYIFYLNGDVKPPDLTQYGNRTEDIVIHPDILVGISTDELMEVFEAILSDDVDYQDNPGVLKTGVSPQDYAREILSKRVVLKNPSPGDYIRAVEEFVVLLTISLSNDRIEGKREVLSCGNLWGLVADNCVEVYTYSRPHAEMLRRIAQYHILKLGGVFPYLGYNIQHYSEPLNLKGELKKELKKDEMSMIIGTIREYRETYRGTWTGYRKQMEIYNYILIDYLQRYRNMVYGDDEIEYLFPDQFYNVLGERKERSAQKSKLGLK